MREIFGPRPEHDPGAVFYTITEGDVGKRVLHTEIGPIALVDVMGYVLPNDVGKRLYRRLTDAGDHYFWQVENNQQRDTRLGITA